MNEASRVLIIGIGNAFRSDDAAGLVAARELKASPWPRDVPVIIEHSGEAMTLIESWKGFDPVIIIDAVHSGGAPGAIHRFEVPGNPLPKQRFGGSTHALSLVEAVELARVLGQLPRRLVIFGIEGAEFSMGESLSAPVAEAVQKTTARIVETISQGGSLLDQRLTDG